MVSRLSRVKELILEVLSDGNEHTSEEIREYILQNGVEVETKSSVIRTAIYQLRGSGKEIISRERGVYQVEGKKTRKECPLLKGFVTVAPQEKKTAMCVYVHEDGKITLSGRLNSEIKTRKIEIRVSRDAKRIALIPEGECVHVFTKAGTVKNVELSKEMKSKHQTLPAKFVMDRDRESGIWIGKIQKNSKTTKIAKC